MDDDMDSEELAATNDVALNALIDLLIKKGVITEHEWDQALDEADPDDDDEEPF